MSPFSNHRGATLLGVLVLAGALSLFSLALGRGIFLIERLRRDASCRKEALFLAVNTLEDLKRKRLEIPAWGEVREGELKAVFKVQEFSDSLLLFRVEVFKENGGGLYVLETLTFK
jgi:hypothetical protein